MRIMLPPCITFDGDKVSDQKTISRIHASAHRNCSFRNSITVEVTINNI